MPSGSAEKAQQPVGSGFPGSNLYPNKNIWSTFPHSNARDRSAGPKGACVPSSRDSMTDCVSAAAFVSPPSPPLSITHPCPARRLTTVNAEPEENPTGSSALHANSEADVWVSNSKPWNTENPARSVSNSPGRARDAGIPNTSAFYANHHPAAIGMKKDVLGGPGSFIDESDAFAFAASQKRGPQDAAYIDPITAFAQPRDASLPPSRQSQGSPAFAELYHQGSGHTPSNSIHSTRQLPNHSLSFPQVANQRAFSLNRQVDDDISLRMARQINLTNGSPSGQPFNPASVPFHSNPASVPWLSEGGPSRLSSGFEFGTDPLLSQLSAARRPSLDRVSPAPGSAYRLDSGSSSRVFAPGAEAWMSRPSSRGQRTVDHERRPSGQQFAASNFPAQYYPNQFGYAQIASQYTPSYPEAYTSNFRPMLPSYAVPSIHPGYPLNPMTPIRPSRDQDPSKGMRSALLDEFRVNGNKSNKRYELRDIYNHAVEFSGDQHGSRFIQQKLETANSDEKEQIFREIEPNALQLMKDVFGNYVVQKFFEYGSQLQKKILAEKMKGKVVDLSVQVYACRVVQKALEHILVEQQAELTRELEPEILRVIKDQNGNHVIQKIIELVPRQYIDFIMNAVRGQVTPLASHAYGCRVIQRLLEYGTEADKAEIMAELHASAQILITDQYGNYVAQHVIQNGEPEDRERIIQLVMGQLLTLSKHKFASNVVEKCIEYGTPAQRTTIREQLTTAGADGNNPLQQMMRDQFGNYVIQKMLGQLQGEERDVLVEEIKPQFYSLKKSGASRQLQALEKLLGLSGSKSETSTQSDTNSVTEVPSLTHETNSPQSSSPPSTHVSAVGVPSNDASDKGSGNSIHGVALQVQDVES
ncbi:pumilio domain-containing [Trichoderma arundinaceum]|uniref:Pumilio homology domain family member 3 n=1 Tax=Trichoderma arundinaceum TaxID=490622 RepID=A0A395NGH0_TRIAR|nr:pumilio domain-containing [Trichoderma arundinaceum]